MYFKLKFIKKLVTNLPKIKYLYCLIQYLKYSAMFNKVITCVLTFLKFLKILEL